MHMKDGVAYYGKDVDALSVDELELELDDQLHSRVRCIELGQGLSSKEFVYYRKLQERFKELDTMRAFKFFLEAERRLERARERAA